MPIAVADWSPQNVNLLKDLWAAGLSASQISMRIPGATRSAVIGKAHRLKLQARGQVVRRHPPRIKKEDRQPLPPAVLSLRAVETEYGHSRTAHARVLARKEILAIPLEPPPQRKGKRPTLLQLKDHHCRWPFGDPRHPSFHFCGDPKAGHGPYCAEHAALAYGTIKSVSGGEDEQPAVKRTRPGQLRPANARAA